MDVVTALNVALAGVNLLLFALIGFYVGNARLKTFRSDTELNADHGDGDAGLPTFIVRASPPASDHLVFF